MENCKLLGCGGPFLPKKCTPTCPHFRCAKKALVRTQQKRGGSQQAICTWANDLCSGANCTFAYCEERALLPDGTCELELRKKPIKVREIEEEAKKEDIKMNERVMKKDKKWEF
jgi:hypothetical protein